MTKISFFLYGTSSVFVILLHLFRVEDLTTEGNTYIYRTKVQQIYSPSTAPWAVGRVGLQDTE